MPTIFGLGDGNYASGTFGGTSESAPRISGVIALMYEAYKNISLTPSFEMIRLVLKSSSLDLGFELNQQGAGLANAFDAVSKIIDNDIILASNYSSVMIGNNLNGIFNDTFGVSHPLVENQYLAVKRLYKLQRHRKRTNLEKNLAWRRFSNVLKTFQTCKKISLSRNSQTFFPGIPVPKKELFPGNFPVPGIPVQTLL